MKIILNNLIIFWVLELVVCWKGKEVTCRLSWQRRSSFDAAFHLHTYKLSNPNLPSTLTLTFSVQSGQVKPSEFVSLMLNTYNQLVTGGFMGFRWVLCFSPSLDPNLGESLWSFANQMRQVQPGDCFSPLIVSTCICIAPIFCLTIGCFVPLPWWTVTYTQKNTKRKLKAERYKSKKRSVLNINVCVCSRRVYYGVSHINGN